MRWLHSALPLCVRHGNIGKALPWFTVFSKAQRIFMTNPLRAWVRGCCAFTSGDNENRPCDISITALRELNISGKLLRCLNIPGECQNERSWRKWVSFYCFPPPPPPHLLLCIVYPSFLLWLSAEPFFHPYLTGQSPCLRLSDNVK